jgi:hypothetical protein
MMHDRRALVLVAGVAFVLGVLSGCPAQETQPTTSAAAGGSPGSTAVALPSGAYRVETKAISDSCVPRQTGEAGGEVFIRGMLPRKGEARVNVPLTPRTGHFRADLQLKVGSTLAFGPRPVRPGGTATERYEATVRAVMADSFTLHVVQSWQRIDGGDGGVGDLAPTSSCRAEAELRFTLARKLCAPECGFTFQPSSDGGPFGGTCSCP